MSLKNLEQLGFGWRVPGRLWLAYMTAMLQVLSQAFIYIDYIFIYTSTLLNPLNNPERKWLVIRG